MPNTFQRATENIEHFAQDLIELYHVELEEVKAKIDYVFVFRDPDAEAPALLVRGHRVLGQARINSLKHRVLGLGDAEILLDGDAWGDMPVAEQRALLDHELEHLEVKRHPKTGEYLYDDAHRPQMKLRDHDREHGFFDNIASRHGIASWEVKNLQHMFTQAGREYIPHLVAAPSLTDATESFGGVPSLQHLAQKLKKQ